MSDLPSDDRKTPVVASPGRRILRMLLNPSCIDKVSGQVARGSFIRRPPHPTTGKPRDVHGLSVYFEERMSVSEAASTWPRCNGIAELTVYSDEAEHSFRKSLNTDSDR